MKGEGLLAGSVHSLTFLYLLEYFLTSQKTADKFITEKKGNGSGTVTFFAPMYCKETHRYVFEW